MPAKILIVEDEGLTAMELQRKLKSAGYDVPTFAFSGKEAIKKAEELKPDLVLMDIFLKGKIDGIDAANQIKKDLGIPIIYLTAHGDANTKERAKSTGPSAYLLKPFDIDVLQKNIDRALYNHKEDKNHNNDFNNQSEPEKLPSGPKIIKSPPIDDIISDNTQKEENHRKQIKNLENEKSELLLRIEQYKDSMAKLEENLKIQMELNSDVIFEPEDGKILINDPLNKISMDNANEEIKDSLRRYVRQYNVLMDENKTLRENKSQLKKQLGKVKKEYLDMEKEFKDQLKTLKSQISNLKKANKSLNNDYIKLEKRAISFKDNYEMKINELIQERNQESEKRRFLEKQLENI
ncbi:MAG: response regulator [Methanobacteriaceae archaeon]|nr:response regulator [Methanobacteriaceae archaeon]